MAAGRLKTEDFVGDQRSESSARGFIGFGEEGRRDDRVRRVAKNKSSISGKQLEGFIMRELQLRSSMNLG